MACWRFRRRRLSATAVTTNNRYQRTNKHKKIDFLSQLLNRCLFED